MQSFSAVQVLPTTPLTEFSSKHFELLLPVTPIYPERHDPHVLSIPAPQSSRCKALHTGALVQFTVFNAAAILFVVVIARSISDDENALAKLDSSSELRNDVSTVSLSALSTLAVA
jgi:hypothetical protein